MIDPLAIVALFLVALLAGIYTLFGAEAVIWFYSLSVLGGGVLFLTWWWWAHTWPQHAWRKPGEPGPWTLLWRRITRR